MDYLQKEPIDVSVIMTTYGHELFIIDAIKGVINQDFVGHVELIISNDNSPDNTNKVVLEFLENAIIPDNLSVKYYLQESNLGAIENFLWCINESQGKFLAICEGDDYWTDTQKLSKQVSFLNKNRDFSIVFSNVNVQIENGEYNQKNELTPIDSNKEYNGEEIIESWVAHTSTFVIRNGKHIKDFVGFFRTHNFMYGDTPLFLYALKFGKGFGLTDYTSTYRRHAGGLTNQIQNNEFYLKFITHLENIKKAFNNEEYQKVLNKGIIGFYLRLFFNKKSNYLQKTKFLLKALKYDKLLIFNIVKEKLNKEKVSNSLSTNNK